MTSSGEGQVPVGELLDRTAPAGNPTPWWKLAVNWRNWSVPLKLAAIVLVPIIVAVVLGTIQITTKAEQSDRYQRIDQLVSVNSDVHAVLDGLQKERTQTAALLAQGAAATSPELDQTRQAVDNSTQALTASLGQTVTDASASSDASTQLAKVSGLRIQVGAGQVDAVQAVTEYSDITSALLRLEASLVAGMTEENIGGAPRALHDLELVREELTASQALGGYGIAKGNLAPSELNRLRTAEVRLEDRLADFRAVAPVAQRADFDKTVSAALDRRSSLAKTMVGGQGNSATNPFQTISAQQWADSSAAASSAVGEAVGRLSDTVRTTTSELASSASTELFVLSLLLMLALVLTALALFFIIRQLVNSLRLLRTSALDVANRELPLAVQNVQDGKAQAVAAQPVPIASTDEIGQLARAFETLRGQALSLAVEQATIRTGYGSVFVNLSRRSQSLVQRQLNLIERLERDEEDADQLATLFQLDHLATRMRRNNENLMVLSGAEPGRRFGQPISSNDVLRAAVSEIEQYQRVVLQPPPPVRIVGYAASDLMRLVAELLDNATSFSAPETQVTVVTQLTELGSLSIDILDKGIGMNEAEVAEANVRLTEVGSIDLATSRRMGLFVVGRLAGRHGIGVVLHGGKDILGVRATVTVPSGLVMGAPVAPADRALAPGVSPSSLPRRPRPTARTEAEAAEVAGPTAFMSPSGSMKPSPVQREETRPVQEAVPAQGATPVQEAASDSEVLPSGKALFEANTNALTDWWSEAAAASDTAESAEVPALSMGPEVTPIFDEMLSVWFRGPTAPPEGEEEHGTDAIGEDDNSNDGTDSADEPPTSLPQWDFASDERWRAVQAISQVGPSNFTTAGLPQRQRGEQLLPGSAVPVTPLEAETSRREPVRNPTEIRGRLSSFQRGISQGRRAKHAAEPTEGSAPTEPTEVSERAEASKPTGNSEFPQSSSSAANIADTADTAANTVEVKIPEVKTSGTESPSTGVSQDSVSEDATVVTTPVSDATVVTEPVTPPAWSFATDKSAAAAQSISDSSAATLTSSGLPRRRRGEQLLPGSAGVRESVAPKPDRNAQEVRGRLSSFQQGVRRGRHQAVRTDEPREDNQSPPEVASE